MSNSDDKDSSSSLPQVLSSTSSNTFTIHPSTLCLLLALLSLSSQQCCRNPPLPPYPQFPTIPPPMTLPQTNHSLCNWRFARFLSKKMGLAALTSKAWWRTLTLHLQVSFSMSLKVATSTPSTSQIPCMGNGTTKAAPGSPSTYSIMPTIHMSLALKAEGTPNTLSQSTLVDKLTTTPP